MQQRVESMACLLGLFIWVPEALGDVMLTGVPSIRGNARSSEFPDMCHAEHETVEPFPSGLAKSALPVPAA